MDIVRDTRFCVTNWSALPKERWPNVVACAQQKGPIKWSWAKRYTPLSIKFLLSAKETYEFDNRMVTVDQDSFLIINEGTEYGSHIDSDTDVRTASIFITEEMCSRVYGALAESEDTLLGDPDRLLKAPNFVQRLYPRDASLTALLTRIHDLANADSDGLELEEQILILTERMFLLNDAVRKEVDRLPFAKAATREETYRRLHVARDFMLSDLEGAHSLERISAVAGFAPHHFLRMFTKTFGMTPQRYLTQMRLDKARTLICSTSQSITEICAEVGFESLGSFSNAYKRAFGVSPVQDKSTRWTPVNV